MKNIYTMNLFRELVITAPVSNRLQFGENENIIISAVDTEVRKIKGLPIKANTFITLSQVDPVSGKIIAQNEFNFWNLDSTTDFVVSNFIEEMTSLAAILEAVGKDPVDYESAILAVLGDNDVDAFVKTKDGAKLMQDVLQNAFYDMVKDSLGGACPLLKCKLIVNKKGYLEISKVSEWILPMTSEKLLPEINSQELRIRAESLTSSAPKQVAPDTLGTAKDNTAPTPEKSVASGAGFAGL